MSMCADVNVSYRHKKLLLLTLGSAPTPGDRPPLRAVWEQGTLRGREARWRHALLPGVSRCMLTCAKQRAGHRIGPHVVLVDRPGGPTYSCAFLSVKTVVRRRCRRVTLSAWQLRRASPGNIWYRRWLT